MAIHVALSHSTRYRYDRLVALSPHTVRLRPAPHCRTPVVSYSLKVDPRTQFLNWQQDPHGNYLARVVFPEKTRELTVNVDLVVELSVINPAGIFGPILGPDFSSSIDLVTRLLKGMPGCPRLYFGVVDVRDVADLHLRAMTHPAARGERFIATSGDVMSMLAIATILRERLGDAARKVPTRELPSWLVRVAARFDRTLKTVVPLLDSTRHATSAKAERLLEWRPRSPEDAIMATAESLIKFGIVTASAR